MTLGMASQLAMILTGTYVILLDPSGRNLPEDHKWNSFVAPIENLRRYVPIVSIMYPSYYLVLKNFLASTLDTSKFLMVCSDIVLMTTTMKA